MLPPYDPGILLSTHLGSVLGSNLKKISKHNIKLLNKCAVQCLLQANFQDVAVVACVNMRSSALLELQLNERTEPSSVLYMNCLLPSPLPLNLLLPPGCQQDAYHLASTIMMLSLLAIEKVVQCISCIVVVLCVCLSSTDRSA